MGIAIILRDARKPGAVQDVFPVHGVGGIMGTLLAGIFCSEALGGFGFGAGNVSMADQFTVQALGVASTTVYTAVATWVIWKLVGVVGAIRVSDEIEHSGLDGALHGERGYDMENN